MRNERHTQICARGELCSANVQAVLKSSRMWTFAHVASMAQPNGGCPIGGNVQDRGGGGGRARRVIFYRKSQKSQLSSITHRRQPSPRRMDRTKFSAQHLLRERILIGELHRLLILVDGVSVVLVYNLQSAFSLSSFDLNMLKYRSVKECPRVRLAREAQSQF